MSSTSAYRENAEHCLRMARASSEDSDRPFWLSMALSWLHLAEHSTRRQMKLEDAGPGICRRMS